MTVLIAAGGTAGHINPALAIADGIRARWPGADVHFAGRQKGMESDLVARAGYPFHHIEVRGIQRSVAPKSLARNAAAAWYLAKAPLAAAKILKEVQPDLVIGTGGYVSGPVVRTAAKRGIKTALHEQNAFPGVTNRLLAPDVDRIFAPGEQAAKRLGHPEKTVVTGNPVQPALFRQNRDAAREGLFAGERVVIVSFGGSLGAMKVNEVVAGLAKWHLANRDFLHIHATGSIEKDEFARMAEEAGIAGKQNFIIREYIDDMPAMLAAADLVISRAGALTLAEIAAVGRASVLIPSPNVAENHQYHNAQEFSKVGAARVLPEKGLTTELLVETVDALTQDPATLAEMGRAAATLANPGALDKIVDSLAELMREDNPV